MKRVTAAFLLLLLSNYSCADIILETAILGETGQTTEGWTLGDGQFLGARFTVAKPVQVTSIGGHIYQSNGTLFGAIVRLSGIESLPGILNANWLAWTVFSGESPSSDLLTPLSVALQPGTYALIFGSGQFGASGQGTMPYNNVENSGQASFFSGNVSPPNGNWSDDNFDNARFVIEGSPIKEIFTDGFEEPSFEATISVSGDDGYELYVNGQYVGGNSSWFVAESWEVLLTEGKNVFAIKGLNAANGQHPGAFIADILFRKNRIVSDSTWLISTEFVDGWQDVDGHLVNESQAIEYGTIYSTTWWYRYYNETFLLGESQFPMDSNAKWIWSTGLQTDAIVYSRKEIMVD